MLVNITEDLSEQQILKLVKANSKVEMIQFLNFSFQGFAPETYQLANELLIKKYPSAKVRVVDYLNNFTNLTFLRYLSNTKLLLLDLTKAFDLSPINQYLQLSSLGISMAKGRIDIGVISKQQAVEYLFLAGNIKNEEFIGQLTNLTTFTFGITGCKSVAFLKPLHKLQNLHFQFGGEKDYSALPDIGQIEHLSFLRVKKLKNEDLYPVNQMRHLKYLKLQDQPLITSLDWITNKALTIELDNVKGLKSNC